MLAALVHCVDPGAMHGPARRLGASELGCPANTLHPPGDFLVSWASGVIYLAH